MKRNFSWGDGISYTTTKWDCEHHAAVNTAGGTDMPSGVETIEMEGFDTPNFVSRKNAGELLPCTPYERWECRGSATGKWEVLWTTSAPGYGWCKYQGFYINKYRFNWLLSRSYCERWVSDHGDQLVQSAAANLVGKSFDALTFLAELKPTLAMVKTVKDRLLDLYTNPKLSKFRDAWLEGRYGWRPLIGDLQTLYDMVVRVKESRTRWTNAVGLTEGSFDRSIVDHGVDSIGGYIRELYEYNDSWKCSHRGYVCADIELPTFRMNPLLTGWELIPLSFVFDWFVGIGTALDAMEFNMRKLQSVSASGHKLTVTRNCYRVPWDGWRNASAESLGGVFTVEAEGNCTVLWTKRQPRLVNFTPQWNVSLDWMKAIDMLALISQRLR